MSTTTQQTPSERIVNEATSWEGVSSHWGGRGELSLRYGKKEIGHLHGDRVAHFGFPRAQWAELLAAGRITRHPIDHDGWGARAITGDEDIEEVIALLRLNYDRAR